jgi:hypothetical protein
MAKVIRLTEKDLTKLVGKIVSEQSKIKLPVPNPGKKPLQPKKVDLGIPYDNPLWQELDNWVTGDGPEVMEYVPNKKLVIGSSDGTKLVPDYTIIKH